MIALALLLILAAVTYVVVVRTGRSLRPLSQALSFRLQKLWLDAQKSLRNRNYLRAEKALLTILKFDERNAAAYNRLGILYAKQHEYRDAIDCFEIASSIEDNASSLHNLGLIYYETHQYQKAAQAFENALELEDNLAARHIAYAKVQEKLGNTEQMLSSLERAVELEPNPQTFRLLADAYIRAGKEEQAAEIMKKIRRTVQTSQRRRRVRQPRKVIM